MSEQASAAASERQPSLAGTTTPARARKLQRVVQRQQVAGVCNGIADYAELRVDWVRTFFILATLATAGLFNLVYVALAVILTVDHSRDAEPGPQAR